MRASKFYEKSEELIDECLEIMKSKGIAYSGKDDSFANFKRVAKSLSMTQYQVWYVYFAKHVDSLASWIREEYSDSEPIKSRIMDLINYLILLNGMIEEDKEMLKCCKDKISCHPAYGGVTDFKVDHEDEEHEDDELDIPKTFSGVFQEESLKYNKDSDKVDEKIGK